MKRMVYITEENERLVMNSADRRSRETGTNAASRTEMKRLLMNVLSGELTERQHRCLTDYYLNGKKEYEIAEELGLCPSTVCRHIACAERKLRRVARYYGMTPAI